MQFDWTTFVLEIINFLVLLWILGRFVYRPVLGAIDARQRRLKDEDERAGRLQAEAAALKSRYEERLSDWAREREAAQHKLDEDLGRAHAAAVEELKKSLADQEAKASARDQALAAARDAAARRQADEAAFAAAAAMLSRLATPGLTARIAEVVAEDLGGMSDTELAPLREAVQSLEPDARVDVATAHPLDQAAQEHVRAALAKAAGRALDASFHLAPELVGGLRIAVGECLLHANLGDELEFFRRNSGHG